MGWSTPWRRDRRATGPPSQPQRLCGPGALLWQPLTQRHLRRGLCGLRYPVTRSPAPIYEQVPRMKTLLSIGLASILGLTVVSAHAVRTTSGCDAFALAGSV